MTTGKAKPLLPLSSEEMSTVRLLYIEDPRNVVENVLKQFFYALYFSLSFLAHGSIQSWLFHAVTFPVEIDICC